jgi:hypothetical protein
LFVGIPIIWGPLFFVFIFGDFKGSASNFLLAAGMIRLLQNNLPVPAYVRRQWVPYVHSSAREIPGHKQKSGLGLRG